MEKMFKAQQDYIEFLEHVINDNSNEIFKMSSVKTSMKSYRNKIKKRRREWTIETKD